ncbi:tumor protein D52-like isoform X2 [Argiope bruennichi]|uniref:tumor protein D52-like isoform X2 n=1 Tax=Argiope bruennichi TaxID=94029 RepID=UPI00249504F8|nr:tumor protein D52-like isoform X2 [Argiope bruennichi]
MHDPNANSSLETSLEEDLYMPDFEFSDHVGKGKNSSFWNGIYFGADHENAKYQRFSRIAAAQEMEDFDSFYDTSEEAAFSMSPDSGVHDMSQLTPEAKAKLQDEWTRELAKTEDEINTLRQVLSSKIRHMQELKRKLGITVWKEFKEDMEQGIRNIQESTAYQKTSQTLKTASEKTTEALGTIGATVSKKFEEVKQSQAFKSLEEKVGSAYTNVKETPTEHQ